MGFLDWLWGDEESSTPTPTAEQNEWAGLTTKVDGYDGSGTYNQYSEIDYDALSLNTSTGTYSEASFNPMRDRSVLGMPLRYNDLADPNGRVYNETIVQDLPLVYIVPGTPTLNKNLIDEAGGAINPLAMAQKLQGLGDNGFSIGVRGVSDGNDLRYLGFKAAYGEYFDYVQTMLSTVYGYLKMSIGSNVFDVFKFTDEFRSSFKDYGVCYYCDKATSVSESASNSYGESKMAQQTNEKSATAREAAMLGRGGVTEWSASVAEGLKSMSLTSVLDSFKSYDGIISRTSNALFRVVNGSELYFPEIWQDSKFDRSYNISFKFYSPYGDKMSVFKYVYVPLISLLAFTLPRQDSILSYNEPFLTRIFCPGMFDISMGAVTGMTINKGGSDNLWTIDGLPQAVEVTLDVIDMYPTLTQVDSPGLVIYNSSVTGL